MRGTKEGVAMEPSQRKLRWGALNRGELGAAEVALLAKDICINGGTYCRAHLLINCHQCRVDFQGNHDHDNFIEMGEDMKVGKNVLTTAFMTQSNLNRQVHTRTYCEFERVQTRS